MAIRRETALISPAALQAELRDPRLRLFDTTVVMARSAEGVLSISSGRESYVRAHVPGAGFLDLIADFSDPQSDLPFMLPSAAQFARAASAAGIGPEHRVVLYNSGPMWWSTRFWFMFREFGFDAVAVLDGGFSRWCAEGREVASGGQRFPPATFTAGARRGFFVAKADVVRAVASGERTLVNALSADQHAGRAVQFSRPGHIAGSCHLSALDLVDAQQSFLPNEQLQQRLAAAGLLGGKPVIAYCGGGIAATANAFALWLVGQDGAQIYDGSLAEWTRDPTLPMATNL
jgi:thiosulfate/3-mercaptopyruvate sulfurtransferase